MSESSTGPRSNVLRLVLPFRTFAHTPVMRTARPLTLAGFVGFPLVAIWVWMREVRNVPVSANGTPDAGVLTHDLKWLDWPFVAYFGAAWLIVLFLLIRPRLTLRPALAVGAVAVVTGTPVAIWLESTLNAQTDNLFSAIFAVGGSEELAKIIPVLAVLVIAVKLWPARRHEVVDLSPKSFLYLGVVSGVVFGCFEAVEYIVNQQRVGSAGLSGTLVLTQTVFYRLITDPINHAMWAGTTCFFIGLAVNRARRNNRMNLSGMLEQSWLIGVGLALTATLHGLHDFANNDLIDAVIDVTSVLLMLSYALAGDIVEAAVATAPSPRWGAKLASAARQAAGPRPETPTPTPANHWSPPPAPADRWSPPPRPADQWQQPTQAPNPHFPPQPPAPQPQHFCGLPQQTRCFPPPPYAAARPPARH